MYKITQEMSCVGDITIMLIVNGNDEESFVF